MYQKGSAQLLWILAVIAIVVGGSYFYLGSKKQNSLQSLKSTPLAQPKSTDYSNRDLGFTLKLSDKFSVKEDSEEEFNKRGNGNFRKNFKGYVGYEPGKPLGAVAVLNKTDSFDNNPLTVWVFDNSSNLTIDKWFENYWYYPFVWGVFDWTSKSHIAPDTEATISGQLAQSKIIAYQPGKPKFMYVANGQKMYLFRIITDTNNTAEKILANFKFLADQKANTENGCKITGCSGQVCSDKDVTTTCEFLAEYACYKNAICERQPNGQCDWTQTEELDRCLQQSSKTSL